MDLSSALDGVSVLTLTRNLPRPAAAARLTELGADVVTVLLLAAADAARDWQARGEERGIPLAEVG
ncbi:CoA transferase [Micrococcus luteus]|nr:CoA transferase [Micrococcus luteus]